MNYRTTIPKTDKDWEDYFHFRWQILRKPWNQPEGSEKDEHEDNAIHRMIVNPDRSVIAIGRLHLIDDETTQIRYMAVSPDYEKQGLGTAILNSLEQAANDVRIAIIKLHARENAVGFYLKHGYRVVEPSHNLYNSIQHYLMEKRINP